VKVTCGVCPSKFPKCCSEVCVGATAECP
jgi:hypothetical protein